MIPCQDTGRWRSWNNLCNGFIPKQIQIIMKKADQVSVSQTGIFNLPDIDN